MAVFLQVRTGRLHLMLDALQVHEVVGLEGVIDGAQGHAQWRDQVLTSIDLGEFFCLPHMPPLMGVVYSPDADSEPVLLKVEEVLGLRDLGAQQWRQLPYLPQRSRVFFESVWLEPEHDRQSFRLIHPITLETFKRDDPAVVGEQFGHDGMHSVHQ
jgi:chemotaxis signal transduction protein